MHDLLTGIFFWVALGVCLIGMLARFIMYFKGLSWQLDRVAYTTYPMEGMKGAFRSIYKWLIPFGTYGWRTQPFVTLAFFGFHLGAVLVPLFLLGHNLFLQEKIGISLFAISSSFADVLSWAAIVSILFLTLRRLVLPEVRIMTTLYDYLILLISVAPFVTGLLARYQVGDYSFWLNMHILSGEILLIAIPFTKLSHVFLFFASRAQLGMDFGIKRGGMKGTKFAW
ncbi:MAG: sulfate respiration complex protein HmcE [Pseudomonadota bacterium]